TNAPFLMSGIDALLERLMAEAADGIEETFAGLSLLEIDVDDLFDRIDDLVLAECGAQDLADARIFRARAAELQLVIFDALLVDAENADMSRVMMAAGIDTA